MTNSSNHRAALDQALLAAIVESSDDGIISIDLSGIIGTWNNGAEKLYGYAAAEIVGQPITVLIPPDRADEELGILNRIRRGERVEHYETVRRRKDGALVDVSLAASWWAVPPWLAVTSHRRSPSPSEAGHTSTDQGAADEAALNSVIDGKSADQAPLASWALGARSHGGPARYSQGRPPKDPSVSQ